MRFLLIFLSLIVFWPGSYSCAAEYTIEINWAIEENASVEVAGLRLYNLQQEKICETLTPDINPMVCSLTSNASTETVTLVSFTSSGIESDPSEPFTIVLEDQLPLEAHFAMTTTEGSLTVSFDATESTGQITEYTWNFNDGSSLSTGEQPTHTFTEWGTYTVSLTIHDESGSSSTLEQELILTEPTDVNQPPTASLVIADGSPFQGDAPLTVSFDASGSSDPDGDALSFSWAFGDGTITEGTALAEHQYTIAGNYTASVTVRDPRGATSTTTCQLVMVTSGTGDTDPTTPTAVITTTNTAGPAPLTITFAGIESTPSEQEGNITEFQWDFGDGSTATGPEVQHMFIDNGSFTVQLTVTDSYGRQASETVDITVSPLGSPNVIPTLIQIYKLLLLNN